ncbi:MAG: extracellular solute-binding protein [bacterium]|nr:extracellular solute-binding protein [bacterium]
MRRMCWRLFVVLLLAGTQAHAQDELVILSPHWEGVRTEFGTAFQELYRTETGREVYLKWLDVGGASDILKYIRSEFKSKPDGIGVDLFFGGGTDPYRELKQLGLLVPYRLPDEALSALVPEINGVPLYDPDFTWYAATMAGFGIVYNKVVLQRLGLPELATWEDLARPELFSWVGSADPRKSGSVHMMYEIILQAYGWTRGWQIITELGANVRSFTANAAQTPKDVALGEVAYGLAIDSYAWAQVREAGEQRIGYLMPENLTVVNGDAVAILEGAPSRAVAERFIQFLLSEAGQKLWMWKQGAPGGPKGFELAKFSVMPGLYSRAQGYSSVNLNPFLWHSDFAYDSHLGSARWGLVNDLIGSLIIDPHNLLREARRVSIASGDGSVPVAVPIDAEEARVLLESGRWKDAAYRSQTLSAWSARAREMYGQSHSGVDILRNLPAIAALILGTGMVVYMRRRSGPRGK